MNKSINFDQDLTAPSKSVWFTLTATVKSVLKNAFVILLRRHELARQRHQLAQLDEAQLADIGLTREMADKEAARPVSDDPFKPKFFI